MTSLLPNLVFALVVLVVAALLVCQGRRRTRPETGDDRDLARGLGEGVGLDLATRIFDSADYRWLRDELGFPQLAQALLRYRKELALRWLSGLRSSFNELVRAQQSAAASAGISDEPGGWAALFYTLRFQFLLGYALLVVHLFGPYHRLVPSYGWLRALVGFRIRRKRFGVADPYRLS